MRSILALIMLGMAILTTGCTRSMPLNYNAGLQAKPAPLSNLKIGVDLFEDQRVLVNKANPQTLSYFATQGPWSFGATYNDKEYVAINSIIQDLFVRELNALGYKAQKTNTTATGDTSTLMQKESLDYLIRGKLLAFDFSNEARMVTVTSRRNVTMALSLLDKDSKPLFDQTFHEVNQENEGMGVMHTTNIDKLMNKVFKKVLIDVANKVSDSLHSPNTTQTAARAPAPMPVSSTPAPSTTTPQKNVVQQHRYITPPPSGFADINDFNKTPIRMAHKQFYLTYLSNPTPKALVVSNKETMYSNIGSDAIDQAFARCLEKYSSCWLYAVDNDVVWQDQWQKRTKLEDLKLRPAEPAAPAAPVATTAAVANP